MPVNFQAWPQRSSEIEDPQFLLTVDVRRWLVLVGKSSKVNL